MVRVCRSNTGRECDSESEGATQGGSVMVRVREKHREYDGEGARKQHAEGV